VCLPQKARWPPMLAPVGYEDASVALARSVARGSVWSSLIIALLLLPSLALAVALAVVTLRDQIPRRRQA
jgi:hypothetical protein